MRRIAHISDLHFGREDAAVVESLAGAIRASEPDVVAMSGDLTQRARVRQFEQAGEFLRALPATRIVVPGNHDISATNLLERVARPLSRYRRYITEDLEPYFQDEEIAVAGINTVRVLSRKNGRINALQVAGACARFGQGSASLVRVVVMHHPIDLVASDPASLLVGRAAMAMTGFADCKVDLFLSGHLHTGNVIATSVRYAGLGHSAVVAHAGTAISTRTRGEANSWNLIEIEAESIAIRRMVWEGEERRFVGRLAARFVRGAGGWAEVAQPEAQARVG